MWLNRQRKQNALLHELAHDGALHDMLKQLPSINLTFPLWQRVGQYHPDIVTLTQPTTLEAIKEHVGNQQPKLNIKLPLFSTYASNTHTLIHELFHAWQDAHGMLLQPMMIADETTVMLDAHSHIIATLLCESMAEVEAIRTSWRLKQAGYSAAWNGATASQNWRYLAYSYANDLSSGMKEADASARCFEHWYQGKHRIFYEKQALQNHQRLLKQVGDNTELRSISLHELVAMMPSNTLLLPALNNPLFTKITSLTVQRNLSKFPRATNSNFRDIHIASVVYLSRL